MCTSLVLVWRNPVDRTWVPVGKLKYQNNEYVFNYTKGARQAHKVSNFVPFGNMIEFGQTYNSKELFPIFKNRVLQKSRPEYKDYLTWLDITEETATPLLELARSGGIRATDSLQLFQIPENNNGFYEANFFTHGLRHLAPSYLERVNSLSPNDKLLLTKDIQNEYDPFALLIRTDDPPELVGYSPVYYAKDFSKLIKQNPISSTTVTVQKVNLTAPVQFRLLCNFKTSWPEGFKPFDDESFEIINNI